MSKLTSRPNLVSRLPDPRLVPGDVPFALDTDLSVESLLEAYRSGFYPKPEDEQGVLWWCPDPRTVLFPKEFKVSRSLKKSDRNRGYDVTLNQNFESVINNCALRYPPRKISFQVSLDCIDRGDYDWLFQLQKARKVLLTYHDGMLTVDHKSREFSFDLLGPDATWITSGIISAYMELHRCGHAHSVETWENGQLVGGLYGVSLGKMFFGESMFSVRTDASKVALFRLTGHLIESGFNLIDCQEPTPLLHSLGARNITRNEYLDILESSTAEESPVSTWRPGEIHS